MTDHPRTLKEGRYLLVDALGEGGMATVWRAYDQRLGVWRAIKLLLPQVARREKLRKRFETEARTMAVLEHRHIVRIYDVDRDGEHLFIVMEMLRGGALVDWLEDHGAMPPRMAVEAMIEVCEGVGFAHSRGVVHRDIKPHNVLLDTDGLCKVTDFGIARAAEPGRSVTQTGAIMGTHGYMAPEQKVDAKSVDARADVYALGCTLYALVANRPPPDLFVSFQDPTMLEPLPACLRELVMTATEYMAEDRYQTAAAFGEAMRAVLLELPAVPRGTPALGRTVASEPAPPSAESFNLPAGAGSIGVTIAPASTSVTVTDRGPIEATLAPEMLEPPDGTLPDREPVPGRSRLPWLLGGALLFSGTVGIVVVFGVAVVFRPVSAPAPEVRVPHSDGVVSVEVAPPSPAAEEVVRSPAPVRPVEPIAPVPAPPTPSPVPAARPSPRPVVAPVPGPVTAPAPSTIVVRVTPDPVPVPVVVSVSVPAPVPTAVPVPVPAPGSAVPSDCIQTQAPHGASIGSAATFSTRVCTAGGGPVVLHYRPAGGGWQQKTMPLALGSHRVQVPLDAGYAGGLEYYVTAGEASDGSRSAPHKVTVR